MHIKIIIAEYILIFFILVGVAVVLKAVLGVPGISERVGEVAKQVLL